MPLTPDDTMRAIRISQAIQAYLDKHPNDRDLSSTDIYDELRKSGLVEVDRHGGIKFREFLKKLLDHNALDLIPQVQFERADKNYIQWHFISMPGKTIKAKNLKPIAKAGKEPNIDLEALRSQIAQLPRRSTHDLTHVQSHTRETYPRAYEIWTPQEEELLKSASAQITDAFVLSKLFGRQPSAIQTRLKNVFGINI